MASAYPAGLDSFATNKANATATTTDHPNHHNDLADAVNKIEAELGIAPSGASATVKARLDGISLEPGLNAGSGVDDVNWDGDDVAAGTAVTVTGTQTLIERRGLLSVTFDDQAAADVNGHMYARTIAIGDRWQVPLRLLGSVENFSMVGIGMSDGTAAGSTVAAGLFYIQGDTGNPAKVDIMSGTFTSMSAGTSLLFTAERLTAPWLYMQIEYASANSFALRVSPDGLSFIDMGWVNVTPTLTPTHVGPIWTKWGGTTPAVGTFGPVVKA